MPTRAKLSAVAAGVALSVAMLTPSISEAGRAVRGGAATSIHRPAGGGAHVNAGGGNRVNNGAVANRSGNHINTGNINTGNVNVGNRTNINIDNDHGSDWDDHYHPVARGVAIGTAAAVTAAVVGSMIYSLPPACSPYQGSYYYCGGVYYEPQYQGDKVVYVVVEQP